MGWSRAAFLNSLEYAEIQPNMKWIKLNENVVFPEETYFHTMDVIGDNMYVFGGLDNERHAKNNLWKFNFAKWKWT